MNINEFLEIVKSELVDSADYITADTKFRELEDWDSLTGMSILVLLEEAYGKRIPDNIFKSCITFFDLYDYIDKN